MELVDVQNFALGRVGKIVAGGACGGKKVILLFRE